MVREVRPWRLKGFEVDSFTKVYFYLFSWTCCFRFSTKERVVKLHINPLCTMFVS